MKCQAFAGNGMVDRKELCACIPQGCESGCLISSTARRKILRVVLIPSPSPNDYSRADPVGAVSNFWK